MKSLKLFSARLFQPARVIFKNTSSHVGIQLWIAAKWHDAILKSDATLQVSTDEAFALLIAKRRGKSR